MGKLFNFISGHNKAGKGITKKQVEFDKKLGFAFFFKLLKTRLGKFSATNLIFALCNIFFFVALFGLAGIFDDSTSTAAHPLYAQINAAAINDSGTGIASLYNIFCASTGIRIISDTSNALMNTIYVLFLTFGISTVGMVYNMRNVCTGEYVDTWHDFFYAIKRNFKQGIIIGILDAVIVCLLVYDILAYGSESGNEFIWLVFYYASIVFIAIYYIMRFYIYLQLVTCEMSIGKIIKNAFLLTVLGIKRNFVGLLGAILFVLLLMYAYILLPQFTFILLCMFVFSFLTYIGIYCAYPILKKYVIDPYYEDHPDEMPEDPWSTEEPVFIDRG